ncbi:MAG: MerR family transcriptional regulator [Acidimicrobiales bacterium]
MSERTIRYYQNERLLSKPAKRGRNALYTAEHPLVR